MSDLGFSAITDTSEVVELREEIRTLVRRVDRLADRVRELEQRERAVPSPSVASRDEQFPSPCPSSYTGPVVPPLPVVGGGTPSVSGDFFSGRCPVLAVEIHRLQASSTVYLAQGLVWHSHH